MPAPASPTAASPYRCPACAGQGIWHAGRQIVACRSCDTAIDTPPVPPGPIEAFEFLPLLRDRPDSAPPIHPSGIIPFQLTEAEARERLEAWLTNDEHRGSAGSVVIDTMRGIYVPGWTFAAHVRVPWRAMWQRKNRARETVSTAIDGVVELEMDDCFIGASTAIPGGLLRELASFERAALARYDPRYLAGYDVELNAVNLPSAWDAAEAQMQREVDRSVRADAGRGTSEFETWPEWSGQRCRHVLVPVYVAEYTAAGTRDTAFVDGRAGKMTRAGELDLTPAAVDGVTAPDPIVVEAPRTLAGRLGCLAGTFVLLVIVASLVIAALLSLF